MITRINESKILTNHISCKRQCNFDIRKCDPTHKLEQWSCECNNLKKHHVFRKDYIWDPITCSCGNGYNTVSIT